VQSPSWNESGAPDGLGANALGLAVLELLASDPVPAGTAPQPARSTAATNGAELKRRTLIAQRAYPLTVTNAMVLANS